MSWSGGASLHSPVFDYGGVLNPGHTTICLCTVRGFILTPRVVALFVTVNRCVGRLAPLFVLTALFTVVTHAIAVLFTAGLNTRRSDFIVVWEALVAEAGAGTQGLSSPNPSASIASLPFRDPIPTLVLWQVSFYLCLCIGAPCVSGPPWA